MKLSTLNGAWRTWFPVCKTMDCEHGNVSEQIQSFTVFQLGVEVYRTAAVRKRKHVTLELKKILEMHIVVSDFCQDYMKIYCSISHSQLSFLVLFFPLFLVFLV